MSIKLSGDYMGIKEAAREIGVGESRLRQMIVAGTARAVMFSDRVWIMERTEVQRVKALPKTTGRPRKSMA